MSTTIEGKEQPKGDVSDKDPFDNNKYVITKTVSKGLLNISLLTNNSNQLRRLISEGVEKTTIQWLSVVLILLSIALQITMAIMAVFVGKEDINFERHQGKATKLNRTLLILAILTIVINVLITSFSTYKIICV